MAIYREFLVFLVFFVKSISFIMLQRVFSVESIFRRKMFCRKSIVSADSVLQKVSFQQKAFSALFEMSQPIPLFIKGTIRVLLQVSQPIVL